MLPSVNIEPLIPNPIFSSTLICHVLLRGSLNFFSCTSWYLNLDNLVRINRAWLYKEHKVSVLQAKSLIFLRCYGEYVICQRISKGRKWTKLPVLCNMSNIWTFWEFSDMWTQIIPDVVLASSKKTFFFTILSLQYLYFNMLSMLVVHQF